MQAAVRAVRSVSGDCVDCALYLGHACMLGRNVVKRLSMCSQSPSLIPCALHEGRRKPLVKSQHLHTRTFPDVVHP